MFESVKIPLVNIVCVCVSTRRFDIILKCQMSARRTNSHIRKNNVCNSKQTKYATEKEQMSNKKKIHVQKL